MWQKPASSRCLCLSLLSIIRGFMEWGGRQEGAWKLHDTSSAWELNLKISGLWKWRERTRICQNGSDFLFSFSLAWTARQRPLLGGVRFKEKVDAVQGDSVLWKTFPNIHTHTHTHTHTHWLFWLLMLMLSLFSFNQKAEFEMRSGHVSLVGPYWM